MLSQVESIPCATLVPGLGYRLGNIDGARASRAYLLRLATFWRKNEGLSLVFSAVSQSAVCEIEQSFSCRRRVKTLLRPNVLRSRARIDSPARADQKAEALCESARDQAGVV